MKIEGRLTFLVNYDKTRIIIEDENSSIDFVTIELDPEQLSMMLGRLGKVPCILDIKGLDKVGKKMETKTHTFTLPDDFIPYKRNDDQLYELSIKSLGENSEGWIPDKYFGSQNSIQPFINKETGETNYRCDVTLRRWI